MTMINITCIVSLLVALMGAGFLVAMNLDKEYKRDHFKKATVFLVVVVAITMFLGALIYPLSKAVASARTYPDKFTTMTQEQRAHELKELMFPTRNSIFLKSDLEVFKRIREREIQIKEDAKFELVETEKVEEQVTVQDNKQEVKKEEVKQETVKEEVKKPVTETPKPVETKPVVPQKPTAPAGSTPDASILVRRQADAKLLGVLYVPSVNMTPVSVYICESDEYQKRADAANSAYAMANHSWYNKAVQSVEFGDHNNHNFRVNTGIKVGDMAYLNMGDKVVRMRCVETLLKQNVTTYQKAMNKYDHTVVTITCASGNNNRTINKWVITDDSDLNFDELYKIVSSTVSLSWDYIG